MIEFAFLAALFLFVEQISSWCFVRKTSRNFGHSHSSISRADFRPILLGVRIREKEIMWNNLCVAAVSSAGNLELKVGLINRLLHRSLTIPKGSAKLRKGDGYRIRGGLYEVSVTCSQHDQMEIFTTGASLRRLGVTCESNSAPELSEPLRQEQVTGGYEPKSSRISVLVLIVIAVAFFLGAFVLRFYGVGLP